jgi:hypothetical protein
MTQPTGRCVCEEVRYRLDALPLFTHACHCLTCQRESGTAFSMSTIVMREDLAITRGALLENQMSPRSTGFACSECGTLIYVASTRFPTTFRLRPGTLDDASVATPQVHIWVKRKQPWLTLPAGALQFDENYEIDAVWPAASLARMRAGESGRGA